MGRRLDKAAVVAAAAVLADRDGLERLNVSAVAAELGVRAPSLYHHVRGQEGLRRELALAGLSGVVNTLLHATAGRAGADAVRALCVAHRRFALANPSLYLASQWAPAADDEELRAANRELRELVVTVLVAAGLARDDAHHATRNLRAAIHGFVSLELYDGFEPGLDVEQSFDRLVDLLVGLVPTQRRAE
jgi:AcrR family transcriptional regulator